MRERRRCHSSARRSPERRQATESPAGRRRARRPHRAIDDVSTAQDVHDGIIQTIYAVGLNLEYCRLSLRASPDEVEARLGEAIEGLDQAIADIRAYIQDLTQRVGDPGGPSEGHRGVPLTVRPPDVGPGRPPVVMTRRRLRRSWKPRGDLRSSRACGEATANASRHLPWLTSFNPRALRAPCTTICARL